MAEIPAIRLEAMLLGGFERRDSKRQTKLRLSKTRGHVPMRNCLIAAIVLVIGLLVVSAGMQAQTAAPAGATKAAPDLSGLWDARANLVRTAENALCGIQNVCAGITGTPVPPAPSENVEEPQMLPAVAERYKALRQGTTNANGNPRQEFNPSWGGCMPEGPTESLRRRGFELVQFQDVVLLLFDHDHGVRRIYLDGKHPADLKPTWMGHSIGRYDGQTLVVDTTGISDKAWIDIQGHPHTDALQVAERLRRLDPKTLEMEITINDPKTYAKPWTKKVVHVLRQPGPNVWDSTECEELLQLGTHYSAEAKK